MASESDRLLVEQIRQGDARAWDHLIANYEGRLLAFVQRRFQDRAACEDIVQETFIGFLTSLPNFDDRRELQTYLFTIASHKLTDYLRRMGRSPVQKLPAGMEDVFDRQIDEQPGASSIARGDERNRLENEALVRCLGNMLHKWLVEADFLKVQVLELLLVKGWANKDVALQLRISEQQVANIRFAAVKKLAEEIRQAGLSVDVFPEFRESNKV